MKIKNFNELDLILKNSFKKIRDEIKKGDEELNKKFVSFNKKIENVNKSSNSLEKKTSKNLKDYENKVKALSKEINELKKAQKRLLTGASKKVDSKVNAVNSLIERFKKDVINIIKIIKTKTVSQEVFEKRMKTTDENTKKMSSYIKEIVLIRDELKERLSEVKLNRSEISKINSSIDKLNRVVGRLDPLEKNIKEVNKGAAGFVKRDDFKREISDLKTRLDNEVKEVVTNLKEVHKIERLEGDLKQIMKKGASEEELQRLKTEENFVLKSLKEEIKLIKKEVATKASLNKEIERLRLQLSELKSVIGDWNKKVNDELKMKTQSTQFMKQVSSILEQKPVKKISEKEEMELDLKHMDEKHKGNVLKKAVDGFVDFFIEEEDEISEEDIKKAEAERKKEEKIEKIKEKKKIKEEKKRKPKIEIIEDYGEKEKKAKEGPGVMSRMKEGMVNFFFEEVDEREKAKIEEKMAFPEDKIGLEVYKEEDVEKEKKRKKKNGKRIRKTKTEITVGKKKYKKLDKDTFVDDFGKETTYYPEDYFY